MYFAVNSHDTPALNDALSAQIERHQSIHWMALIDKAFDHGGEQLQWHRESIALYDHDDMRPLMEAGPMLLSLSYSDAAQLRKEISALSRHCNGRPMLSFVASSNPMQEVAKQWHPFVKVNTDDDQIYLLRFADTRIAAALPKALRPESWKSLTHALNAWCIVNRTGELEQLPLIADQFKIKNELKLNSNELSRLLELGQPDAVIDVLSDQFPELLPTSKRGDFYNQIVDVCSFAAKYAVTSFPDVVALATLSCLTNGESLKNAHLISLLEKREWESGNLIAKLDAFLG